VDAAAGVAAYPGTINYKPTYFLINGVAYDKTASGSSTFSAGTPGAATQWNVLLRLLNAGTQSHTALPLGLPMTLIAEDGNVLPTLKRRQADALLAAGKTMDVMVSPPPADATYPLFDRMLRLTSGGNQPDSGMLAYLQVGAGTPPPGAGAGPSALDDSYAVSKNTPSQRNLTGEKLDSLANAMTPDLLFPIRAGSGDQQ
jgi:Multicopper oxidase